MPEALILTGPPGSGKSTVALALAERYDRVAHIPLDIVHGLITPTGRVQPWGNAEAWQRQSTLVDRNVCDLASNFLHERFAVIIDGVIADEDRLARYVDALSPLGFPIHYVLLLPRLDVCLERNQRRREGRVREDLVRSAYSAFADAGRAGVAVIDSSEMTAYETADRLQALTTSGASIVWQPSGES